jgi:hypothetical protein
MLDEYQTGILLHGGNWESVRDIARTLERNVFLAGYYKAFAFACGPCWLCKTCAVAKRKQGMVAACKHPDKARPAMEAAGIDVFATAHAAGLPIEVVRSEGCPQNYYNDPLQCQTLPLVGFWVDGKLLPPDIVARRQGSWLVGCRRMWHGPKWCWRLKVGGVANAGDGCMYALIAAAGSSRSMVRGF